MRFRYSAFVFQRANYLLAIWHASTRPTALDFAPCAKRLGLDVRSHRPYQHSCFVRESGR